jgi:hypothetical protein
MMIRRGWVEEVDTDMRKAEPLWRETGDLRVLQKADYSMRTCGAMGENVGELLDLSAAQV